MQKQFKPFFPQLPVQNDTKMEENSGERTEKRKNAMTPPDVFLRRRKIV